MLCDKCKKNEATVHIREFHNGKQTDIHLCNECAGNAENDTHLPGIGFNLAEVLYNVNKIAEKLSPDQKDKTDGSSCPVCGWTAEKIRKHDGKLGCPSCYNTFDNLVKQALAQVQRGTLHLGKRPHGSGGESPAIKRSELDNLKKELQKLISKEEYEAAALCRDRINILKAEIDNMEAEK